MHQVRAKDQFLMSHLQNTFVSLQYFVDKNVHQMKREHIHCSSRIFLNMNCILLTLVLHQIFQIYFGKQNISKQSRLQIVSLAVHKNKTKGKKITARTLLVKEQCNNIFKLDEWYYIFAQLEAVLHTLLLKRKRSWHWFDNLACQPSSTPYQQQIQNGQMYLYASVSSLMVQIIQKLILTKCHS